MEIFIVVCRADTNEDGSPGNYELATRRMFASEHHANLYASGINSSRQPIVVKGRFTELEFR